MIHSALVSAYPTEAEARAAFTPAAEAPYLGVADLARAGWSKEDA